MTVWIGLGVALIASGLSLPLSRRWGTVVVCVPIVSWAVAFGVATARGLSVSDNERYLWALFGIVIGSAMGIAAESIFRRRWPRRPHTR